MLNKCEIIPCNLNAGRKLKVIQTARTPFSVFAVLVYTFGQGLNFPCVTTSGEHAPLTLRLDVESGAVLHCWWGVRGGIGTVMMMQLDLKIYRAVSSRVLQVFPGMFPLRGHHHCRELPGSWSRLGAGFMEDLLRFVSFKSTCLPIWWKVHSTRISCPFAKMYFQRSLVDVGRK